MVDSLERLHHDASVARTFAGAGGPWEFNLRDLLRWCELAETAVPAGGGGGGGGGDCGDDGGSGGDGGGDGNSSGDGMQRQGESAALDAAVRHYASLLFLQRLRTADDRRHAAAVFAAAWGGAAVGQPRQHPELHVSPNALQVGWARLARAGAAGAALEGASSSDALASQLALLPGALPVLESLAECAGRGWMCLLVGPAAGGKTAAVRGLAALAGQPLLELSLTSGTDTSDLLGGFEQVEAARKVQEAARRVQGLLGGAAELLLPALRLGDERQAALLRGLAAAWEAARSAASLDAAAAEAGGSALAAPTAKAQHAQQVEAVAALLRVLAQLQQLLAALATLEAAAGDVAAQAHVAALQGQAGDAGGATAELAASLAGGGESAAGKFEWVDGALTR